MTSDKAKLLNYLKSQHTMYLATYDGKPWTTTVFYAVDDDFNLYFISEPNTRHVKAIKKNKFVSCSIADSNQVVTDKKIGVQIEGIASE
ncbi:pyridoxamine 5'-phosphate oxidase family protein, partial [Candidatus Roizmanbacteria bacterium]|nr:pyridoxamine 5'-phosphate oxidase family protein [Candidatus Roizmanbacteria bacterium]